VIEQLFGSKTRVKLLQLFFENPNRSFYVREITRKIDEQINSVRRELANLLSIGIITSDANNNRLYYEVNQKFEHYKPLAMIFGSLTAADTPVEEATAPAEKTDKQADKPAAKPAPAKPKTDTPKEHPMAKDLHAVGKVELALLTGQFTRDERSGIDMLAVGDINATKMAKFVEELEQAEKKEIRYTVMTPSNYKYRKQIHDRFLTNLLESKNQIIIGDVDLT
jgi:hypothetical protein